MRSLQRNKQKFKFKPATNSATKEELESTKYLVLKPHQSDMLLTKGNFCLLNELLGYCAR